MELSQLLHHHARYRPQAETVVIEDERYTAAAFAARVDRAAGALQAAGVQPGDRVATVLPNCRELLELYWAVPQCGAVLVPLSPLLLADGLASLLNDAGATCVITQAGLRREFDAATALAAERRRICLIDAGPDDLAAGYGDWPAMTAAATPLATPHRAQPDDLFNLMYTSGTTGQPKGIMHSHRIRAAYALGFTAAWRMTPESVVLHTGAIVFNGAFTTLMPAFLLGARYVLARQFSPARTLELIEREGVTHIMLVPSQIVALLNHPDFAPERLASLQMVLSLGAPLLKEHKDALNQALPGRFYELYGLTEGFVTILDRNDTVRKAGSVGVPQPLSELRIVREDGSAAEVGEVGEIVGRGPILMQGYYGRPDLTAAAIRDGWLHSGDLGYVDEDGYLYLVDRIKDMIDTGGVKVYPRDLEELIARHPAVREVAVFGVPDDKWGETPHAAVVLKAPGTASAAELQEWINTRVAAKYQRVSGVTLHEDFPRNAAGKTLKRELRAPYWAGKGRMI